MRARSKAVPDFMAPSELLPRDPPPAFARSMARFVVAVVAAAAIFVFFVRLPETVESPFVLVPETGADELKTPRHGTLERVLASDAEVFKAGTPLFVLRSEEFRVLSEDRAAAQRELASLGPRLVDLAEEGEARARSGAARVEAARSHLARLERDMAEQRALDESLAARHALAREQSRAHIARLEGLAVVTSERAAATAQLFARTDEAAREGAITSLSAFREALGAIDARREHEQALSALAEQRDALATLDEARRNEVRERAVLQAQLAGDTDEARHEVERVESAERADAAERRTQREELSRAKDTAVIRIASLARELEGVDGDLLRIAAPYDGVIVHLGPRAGAVLERGAVLCELARADAPLVAELSIPERQVGEVVVGTRVTFLFSAYPYTRFGVKHGKLAWVSPLGSDETFRALARQDETSIVVNGVSRPFRPGMGGEARIEKGRRRTLFELALEPLEALRQAVAPR